MKFLHTADWQIGRQYERFGPEDGPALAEARIATVERIARLAAEESVAAVLVAGDVFDAQTVSDRTVRRLFNAARGFTGPWIMIPGNHDAALAESVWTRAVRLNAVPDHVHLALEPEPLLFPDRGFAVLPAPLTQRHTYGDLTAWFDTVETPPGLARIGLAHGSVEGVLMEGIDSPNPIAGDRTSRARLDYLALGDWHGTRQINARTWYSGTPEQDRFKDNGAGQVLLVELAEPGFEPKVTPVAIGQYAWLQWQQSLRVASDLDQFIQRLEQIGRPSVLNVVLEGQLDLNADQRLRDALSEAEAKHRGLLCDTSGLRLHPTA
ncbi:MAG: DNA repair exonuclease, partial [Bacteroidales bacterium]|nr:DNA repair exonuclease [Bacteroidales bacterium]